MVAGMKFLEIDNSSLSRLTKVAGRFSCTNATWIASIGLSVVSVWIWLAESTVMSLGTRIFNRSLILAISFSICVLVILVLMRRKERNSIMLMMLVAPFTFLAWIISRISSTASHSGLPVRDSFSWASQLNRTSVSRNIKLDSAIISIAESADNFDAAFTFTKSTFESTGEGLNDICRLRNLSSKKWLKCDYSFLKSWAHNLCLLLLLIYHSFRQKSIQITLT